MIDTSKDHETRIRLLENKVVHFVSGKQLWIGFASAVGVASPVAGFLVWLINGR